MPYKDIEKKRKRAREYSVEYFQRLKNEPDFLLDRRQRLKDWRLQKRRLVIAHYGGKCSCCGETEFRFLTISHPNNDGKEHRQMLSERHTEIYDWLVRNNFPADYAITIECWNCNFGRRSNNGICPHKGGMRPNGSILSS